MRIAVLSYAADTEAARAASPTSLLSRRSTELAADLADLGHVVHHVEVEATAARFRAGRAGSRVQRLAGATFSTTTPGRELSEVVAARPDVVLGVGTAAGQALDLMVGGLRCPWVWSPGAVADGTAELGPTTAVRVITQSQLDAALLSPTTVEPGACDVVPWRLAANDSGPMSAADVPLRARSALAVADTAHDGIVDTVRALALLPEHRLVVAVDAAHTPRDIRAQSWMRLAAGLGLAHRIRIAPVRSARDLRSLLNEAGLLIAMPRAGVQRELIAAAMWCGTAVVASDLDDARELVETGCSGLLLPPGDPWRLARAVRMVATDPRGRGLWTRSARRRIRDLAGPEVTVQGVTTILKLAVRTAELAGRASPQVPLPRVATG